MRRVRSADVAADGRRIPGAIVGRVVIRLLLGLTLACAIDLAAAKRVAGQIPAKPTPPEQVVRMRIAWGGGSESRRWSGRIAVADGAFREMQLLGMEADAAGGIWQDGGVIHVNAIRPHRFDGLDVTISGGVGARLSVQLSADGIAAPVLVEAAVMDAARAPIRQPLDDRQNVILIHRSPGDSPRIETDRDSLIFAPGEELSFKLRMLAGELAPGATVDVTTTMTKARGGAPWSVQHPRLPVPIHDDLVAAVTVPLPREEGVYSIRTVLTQPSGFTRGFLPGAGNRPLAERTFQVVVLSQSSERTTAETTYRTVLEFDPANPRWWQRAPLRIPGISQRSMGNTSASVTDHPSGRLVELPPTPKDGEPFWQAYPLPIEAVGAPHVIDVQYPADREQHLGFSLVEPNAAGQVLPIGRDSGAFVEGLGRGRITERHSHRLVFWPRTDSPMLLVTNLHPTAAAQYGRIRVEQASGELGAGAPRAAWQSSERLVAAYLARPLLPENFGATEMVADAASKQSVDDWQTFYESAVRLADYLPYAGYNGAVVSVLSDGSAIYPSRRLQTTPLYHTGRAAAGSSGLPPSDPLELILRVFDRQGLAMIPCIQLASPLPDLEELRRRSDPQRSGIELVGPDGRTWLESQGTARGLAPYYNLLDARVQQAILDVVDELLIRYGHHTALAGIAVQLSGDGYGQLPGLSWGLDDDTILQFERDTGVQLRGGEGPGRFAARQQALRDVHQEKWRAWRAARVSSFYGRLAELVQSTGKQRRLILTSEEAFSSQRSRSQLQPKVLGKVAIDDLLLEQSIDRARLSRTPGVVFCATQYIEPASPLVDRAIDLEISDGFLNSPKTAEKFAAFGTMFFHRPLRTRLASFDAKSPWPSSTWLVTQSSADAAWSRRRLALELNRGDPSVFLNGGEMLAMGQEAATRSLFSALQKVPTAVRPSVYQQQPVTLRVYPTFEGSLLMAINASPWPAECDVALDLPHEADLQSLTAPPSTISTIASAAAQPLVPGRQSWKTVLQPYDVQIVRITSSGVRVAGLSAAVGEPALAELDGELSALSRRDLTRRSEYNVLANPGFEATSGNSVSGWQLESPKPGVTVELDPVSPHGGAHSLYLASRGQLATLQSDPFPTPATGQLFLMAWLRGENLAPNTRIRMVFQTESPGQFYRTSEDTQKSDPLTADWHPYGFPVNDLPLNSFGRMRVKFELDGPGEVWIDDVQLCDLLFPEKGYYQSVAEKSELIILLDAAQKARRDGRVTDSLSILEGYWPRFLLAYTTQREERPSVALQREDLGRETEGEAKDAAAATQGTESAPKSRWWWPIRR